MKRQFTIKIKIETSLKNIIATALPTMTKMKFIGLISLPLLAMNKLMKAVSLRSEEIILEWVRFIFITALMANLLLLEKSISPKLY